MSVMELFSDASSHLLKRSVGLLVLCDRSCPWGILSVTDYRLTHIIRCAAIFHTDILASKNYWADFHEILHGYLLDDYSSDSRGVF